MSATLGVTNSKSLDHLTLLPRLSDLAARFLIVSYEGAPKHNFVKHVYFDEMKGA